MILLIDNNSSFTYSLVHILGELGAETVVCQSDRLALDEVRAMAPGYIVISPGPGYPADAGVSIDVIREFHSRIPILGVSQGHQCIAAAFGGRVEPAPHAGAMHGQARAIYHYGRGVFNGLPSPFTAACYHSLLVHEPLPDGLQVAAFAADGSVMAVEHRSAPLTGVQFHPESILTERGSQIVQNFLVRFRGA